MAQNYAGRSGTAQSGTAQKVQWAYWIMSDVAMEKEFYIALQDLVSSEIRRRFAAGEKISVGREIQFHVGTYAMRARVTNIDPLLATKVNASTIHEARYRERAKDEGQDVSAFIAETIRYPNESLGAAYDALVGIDDFKESLESKLKLLLKPDTMQKWLERHYAGQTLPLLEQILRERYPLIILEGEVGSGKTALARSIGHKLAQDMRTYMVMYVLNAQIRGGGHVGELTQNISRAFNEAELSYEREQIPVLLFIDEADALAQSRGGKQTHHEDDAGVNTLIQRIDRLRGRPIAVIFATNLFTSLDSAILRRASATYKFRRPTFEQRLELFRMILEPIGSFSHRDFRELAHFTVPGEHIDDDPKVHRYTYSDITQRILPEAVEQALNAEIPGELTIDALKYACGHIRPTPETHEVSEEDMEDAKIDPYGPLEDLTAEA